MNRRFLALTLLLAIVPPATGTGTLLLEASVDRATVTATLTTAAEERRVYVLLTHEDPLAGIVVDRLVPVTVPASSAVEVEVTGLRPEVSLNAYVLDRDVRLPTFSSVSSLLNGTAVPGLGALATAALGRIAALDEPTTRYGYSYERDIHRAAYRGVAVAFPAGAVAVASMGQESAWVRVSGDGGHRFSPPLRVDNETYFAASYYPGTTDEVGVSAQLGHDGAFLFFSAHAREVSEVRAWTLARLEPLTMRLDRVTHTTAPVRPVAAQTLLADGTGLLASPRPEGIRLVALAADGSVGERGLVEYGDHPPTSDEVTLAAGPGTGVGLLYRDRNGHLVYALSLDQGHTWSSPRALVLPPGARDAGFPRMVVDALGTAHAALVASDGSNSTVAYVRMAVGQAPFVRIAGRDVPWNGKPIQAVTEAQVVVSGPRVWLLADVSTKDEIQIVSPNLGALRRMPVAWESVDLGRNFSRPHRFQVAGLPSFHFHGAPALFPDGRPLLLGRGDAGGTVAVPLFDPFPEPACAERAPETATPAPTTQEPGRPATTCPDRFDPGLVPGDVEIRSAAYRSPEALPLPSPEVVLANPTTVAVGAVALVGAVLLSTEGARYGLGAIVGSLFARVRGPAVLRNAIREVIYAYVQANPGIRFGRLRRELHLSHGAAAYHLRVLEKNRLVRSRQHWTRRHYYPDTVTPPSPSPAPDVVVEALRRRPGSRPAELARELGLSRQLVHYHLQRLARTGRVMARRSERDVRYSVPPGPRP